MATIRCERVATVRPNRLLTLVLGALVLALSVLAGCGGGDDGTPSSGAPDVTVNATTTAAVDPAGETATKDPAAVRIPGIRQLEPLRRRHGEPSAPSIPR